MLLAGSLLAHGLRSSSLVFVSSKTFSMPRRFTQSRTSSVYSLAANCQLSPASGFCQVTRRRCRMQVSEATCSSQRTTALKASARSHANSPPRWKLRLSFGRKRVESVRVLGLVPELEVHAGAVTDADHLAPDGGSGAQFFPLGAFEQAEFVFLATQLLIAGIEAAQLMGDCTRPTDQRVPAA